MFDDVLVARDAVTKYHRLGGWNTKIYFLKILEALQVWDQGVGRFGLFWGLSPCLVDGLLSLVSSCGLFHCVCVCVSHSPHHKDTSHVGLEPIHMTSFNLITSNYIWPHFTIIIFKYSHILKWQEVRTSAYEFLGDTIQSVTDADYLFICLCAISFFVFFIDIS